MRRTTLALVVVGTVIAGSRIWAAAPACRYTVGVDTVADQETGLTWQRAVPGSTYTWADAATYCQSLNLAGFGSGWRLPGKKELESLVDVAASPSIDAAVFPGTPAAAFWTSTPSARLVGYAWVVNFGNGSSWSVPTTSGYRVRCVR